MLHTRFVVIVMLIAVSFVGVSSRSYADECDLHPPLLDVIDYPHVTVVAPDRVVITNPNTPPVTSEVYIETLDIQAAKVSDSGQWVAYLRYLDEHIQQIWITSISEQDHQLVAEYAPFPALDPLDQPRPAQILQWEWLPDRDMLAYTILTDSTIPLDARDHYMAINGSFAASPDGQQLALQIRDALYWVSMDDVDNPQRITESETYQSIGAGLVHPQPYWLPDSSAFIQILPTTPDISSNQSEIWKYAPDEDPVLIGTIDTNYFNIRVSPTVDRLAYWTTDDDGVTTISISDIDGRNANVILHEADLWFDRWTPDGQHVTYRQMSSPSTSHTYLYPLCDTD